MKDMEKSHHDKVQDILQQQQQLKQAREKISSSLDKKIYVLSGDYSAREQIKAHLETLGFSHDRVKSTNSAYDVINNLKLHIDGIDLIICHLKVIDSRVSSQTGLQLLKIVSDMFLKAGIYETLPFIFMEASYEKNEIISALKAGIPHFLVLPCNQVSLANKLVEAFKKQEDSTVAQEVSGFIFKANKLRDMGDFEAAIAIYNRALRSSEDNVQLLNEKANTLLEMGDMDQAIQIFRHIIEIEAHFPRAYQGLGMAYEQLGDIAESKKNYLKVLEYEPNNVQVQHNLGVIHQKEGDYKSAQLFFDKGIEMNRKFLKNYLGLAENYEVQKKPKEALNVYRKAIKVNPKQTSLYLTAGNFCLKHNMFMEAEVLFTSAIGINEDHLHLYNQLGIALRKQKKFKEAIVNYAKAIKISPDDASLQYNQAKAYYISGDETRAITILKKAFVMDPELKARFGEDKSFSKLLKDHPGKLDF